MHYEIRLANGAAIDPLIYWTPGVNPASASSNTGTGLYAYATPINDVPASGATTGNGVIDDPAPGTGTSEIGSVVKEGGRSYLKVGVNTPHTRAIELRIEFTGAPAGFRTVDRTGAYAVYWNDTEKAAYVTLPATTNQSTPNTSTLIELFMPEEDNDTKNEFLTYTVTAGYLVTDTADRSVQNWYDYNQTARIFTPAENRTLTILDNDEIADAVGTALTGNDGNNTRSYSYGVWYSLHALALHPARRVQRQRHQYRYRRRWKPGDPERPGYRHAHRR